MNCFLRTNRLSCLKAFIVSLSLSSFYSLITITSLRAAAKERAATHYGSQLPNLFCLNETLNFSDQNCGIIPPILF